MKYTCNISSFINIPSYPFDYWLTENMINMFKGKSLQEVEFFPGGRNKTHNNEKYVRFWWEIFDTYRWQPYDKGGEFRKWYGDLYYFVDWSEDAKEEYDSHGGLYNQKYSNKIGICWSLITTGNNSFRVKSPNEHYDSGSPTIFNKSFTLNKMVLGFLNTNVSQFLLKTLNPTLNLGNTYVLSLPYPNIDSNICDDLVDDNIEISKEDWNSFETSWDFKKHPLI